MATPPRQVLPGTVYLVSRRCSERRFFLRPSPATNDIFRFVLAVAAARYGILLHAFCVMSNHYHLVLTDVNGELPHFHQDLDSLVARAVNRAIGHSEAFWDRDSYSAIPLVTPEDVIAKIAYVLANPVAAGLVRRGRDWPGLWSDPAQVGGPPLKVDRPGRFFGKRSVLPPTAQLVLCRPPGFEDDAAFLEALAPALDAEEARAIIKVEESGRRFLGADRAREQNPFDCPASQEPAGRLNPRIAGRAADVRIEALRRWREFLEAYRAALAAWRAGARDVLFPPGTWAMRVHHGARCAAPG